MYMYRYMSMYINMHVHLLVHLHVHRMIATFWYMDRDRTFYFYSDPLTELCCIAFR